MVNSETQKEVIFNDESDYDLLSYDKVIGIQKYCKFYN